MVSIEKQFQSELVFLSKGQLKGEGDGQGLTDFEGGEADWLVAILVDDME